MLGIFKSKRQRIKDVSTRMFENFIPALCGMSSEEIAYVLDEAAGIKSATSMYGEKADVLLLFEDPILVPEDVAFVTLRSWQRHMIEISGTLAGRAKAGALSIWYLSLAACTIVELRPKGRKMWRELERGFPLCTRFSPEDDCVRGLEANRD